ncbi:MAG: hypothetical protein E6J65_28465, partial [Deltaproteobacteria bacterium]
MFAITGVAAISLVALEASSHSTHQPVNQERTSIMTMKDDLANRSLEIHWPRGFDPRKADLFSHDKLLIREFVPFSRIGWYGCAPGSGPTFYHTWYLSRRGNGCLVVTDEVGNGRDAANLRQTDEGLMHRGHDLWLA